MTPELVLLIFRVLSGLLLLAFLGGIAWLMVRDMQLTAAAMAEQERRHAHSGRYADFSGISEHAPGYALSAQWCDGRTLMQCMEVVAQPARPDTRCGTLILRSTGERFIQAAGVREPAPPACWP
jgi:type IV pilus assembly protein PilE